MCSYFLIGYWLKEEESALASQKAFLVTRFGDLLLLSGILLIFANVGSFGFRDFLASNLSLGTQNLVLLLLIGGVIGKSAQLPLQAWLPDAMAAPIPVSALIHAATMVKAGVYLLARIYPVLSDSVLAMTVIAYVGLLTAIIGGYSALGQRDIKRLLAYSTISHVGLMVFAIGLEGFFAGLFHLLNHSAFKAMLFLIAGIVITETGKRKITEMGGSFKNRGILSIAALIGSLSLAGIPPFGGWFSKELILGAVIGYGGWLILVLFFVVVLLSGAYIGKWYFFTFIDNNERVSSGKKISYKLIFPVLALAVLIVLLGGFESFLAHLFGVSESFGINNWARISSTMVAALGFALPSMIYSANIEVSFLESNTVLHRISREGFYFDSVLNFLGESGIRISKAITRFDESVLDALVDLMGNGTIFLSKKMTGFDLVGLDGFVNGLAKATKSISKVIRKIQSGKLKHYLIWLAVGMLTLYFIMKIGGFEKWIIL